MGCFNANTTNGLSNSPALVQGAGVSGHFYIVNVEGTTSLGPGLNDWHVGDWAIFLDEGGQPASWQKIDNTSTLVGSGTAGTFAKWTNATTLNDSIMSESGTVVSVDGDLKVKDTVEATTTNSNLKLKGNGTGGVEIMSADGVTDGKITLNCSQNSHGVTLQSPPHASGATYTLILPTSFGGAGDVLTSAGANPSQLVWTTPTTGTVTGTGTQNYVTKWSAGGAGIENSTIFDDGTNVGIGTSSPASTLHVNSGAANRAATFTSSDPGVSLALIDPNGFAQIQTTSGNLIFDADRDNERSNSYIGFEIDGGSEKMRIDSTGNVGIGTTSPSKKLHVDSGTISDIARFENDNGSFTLGQTSSLTSLDLVSSNAYRIRQGSDVPFYIKSDGNVGIGTSSPSAKIHAESGDDFLGYFKSTDNKAFIGIADNDTTAYISTENSNLSLGGNTGTHPDNLNWDLTNKRLGIGTNNPSTKLDVGGSIKSSSGLVANGSDVAGYVGHGMEIRVDNTGIGGILSYDRTNSQYKAMDIIASEQRFKISGNEKMRIALNGNIGIGTTSPAVSLDISATDAVQMPVGVTGDRPTIATGVSNGMLRYNSSNNGFEGYINGNWGDIGGGSTGGLIFRGTFDASTGAIASGGSLYTCPAGGSGGTVDTAIGDLYIVTTAGSFFCSGTSLNVGDEVICITAATATNDNVNNWNAIASGAGGAVTGSGTTNYVPKFTGATVVGNSSIFNDASGNVGIGTTSPDRTLSIKGNSATNIPLTVESGTGQLNCLIAMRDSNTTTPYKVAIGSATDDMIFRAGGAERMRIDSAGDIGIGTTSPSKKLHVSSGDQSTSRIRLSNTNTGGNDIDLVAGINNVGQDGFSIYNATSNQTQLVVQSGGNVGIGTTSPVSALHVSTTVNEVLTLQSITSSQKIKFNDINNPADDSDFGSVSGDLAMFTNSSGTPNTQSFTFNKDGKLGIGQFSTSPQANLDISDLNFNPSLRLYGANTGSELKIEVSNFFGNFNTTINSAQNDLIFQGNNSAIMSLGVSGSSPSLPTGSLRLNQYGQGNKTGTAVYNLTVDGFGNVIEDPISGGASATITSRQTTTTSATTVFLLGATPNGNSVNFVDVFIDGVYQETTTYSVSGASFDEITFNSPVPSGVTVETKTTADYNVGAAVDTVSLGQSNTTGNVDLRIAPLEVTSGQTIPGNANSLYIFTATGAQSIATVTLPGSPTLGDSIKISNLGGLANVLGANGNKIMGVAADLTINTPTAAFEIIWSGSNNGWIIIGNV